MIVSRQTSSCRSERAGIPTAPHRASLLLLALPFALALTACSPAEAPPAPPPMVVTVAPVEAAAINTTYKNVGRTVAVDSVDLEARVTGFLERRAFQEGTQVERGQLLFEIERGPYLAAVNASRAGVADAESALANAEQYLARLRSVPEGAVAAADLDAGEAAQRAAKARLDAARADLESATINLDYTRIKAPISGQIGRAAVTEGNLVGPTTGVLATIVRLDPMYVTFTVSERDVLDVRQEALAQGSELPTFVPRLELANETAYPYEGEVGFVDNQIDQTTGTLAIRASFKNPDGLLVPGQFVTVLVEREQPEEVFLIPQKAVQQSQAGHSVMVVDRANAVSSRRVTLGDRYQTRWVVEDGLALGEKVIIEGLQKVRPGMTVNPQESRTQGEPATTAEISAEVSADDQ